MPSAETTSLLPLDPDILLPLRDFLRLLPGVHSRKAFGLLTEAWFDALVNGPEVRLGEFVLGDTHENLFPSRDTGVTCLTPAGATRLLVAYREGAIPLAASAKPGEPDPAALAYACSYADLLRRSQEKAEQLRAEQAGRNAERAEIATLIKDPEAVPESRFTYALLDAIFWEHHGAGSGTLPIGGVLVSKSVTPYASNSGSTRDHAVVFEWTGSDGTTHTLEKPSRFSANRRNDAERHWGLPG